ncbi:Cytochrome P450 [Nonomuraea maritima]|uniref:Cytochrome P450 n=1 Tax=Nonomuraea maritima TaxID=683260 RepID=A0A1G8WJ02_9ACTN|nr:cytochrome P450 [Nonomuraea maritima]SDJ78107.1 Cytochrome P450 [Nonomuraea maritima]
MPRGLPRASLLESLRLAGILLPPGHVTRGRDLLRSGALLAALEARHGGRPVLVRGGPRGLRDRALLVLDRHDAARVLLGRDDGFAPPADERPFALRADVLRAEVLRPVFVRIAQEEAAGLRRGILDHARLDAAWQRVARRCVYGDGAASDEELTRLLEGVMRGSRPHALGRRAPRRREVLSGRYDARILDHLRRAEPGSLAGIIAGTPQPESRGLMQAAFWLMGLSRIAAGLTQTLALLAAHPAQRRAARADAVHLRACLREALRLWPPVPALSRVTLTETDWYGSVLPAGASVLVPLAAHTRNPRLPYADRFAPEIWRANGAAADEWWAGHGCDGMQLTLAVGTAFLEAMLRDARPLPHGRLLSAHRPLPRTIDVTRLRVRMRPPRRHPGRS